MKSSKKRVVKKRKNKNNLFFELKKYKKTFLKRFKKYKKSLIRKIKTIKTNNQKMKLLEIKKERELINEKAKKQEEINYRNYLLGREIKKTNKRILLKLSVILIIISFVAGTLILVFNTEDEEIELNNISFSQYKELYSKDELEYIYITENNCAYCELSYPYVVKLQTDYDIIIKSLNISELTDSELVELSNTNSVFEESWKAPILFSIKDGREISSVKGYKEYSVLKRFVEYSMNPSDNNSFIKINVEQYLELLKNEDTTVVYIGNPNSKGCETFVPILEELSIEKEFSVYYLDTSSLDKSEEWNKLTSSSEIFQKTWFVPTLLIIKKSKISSYKMESMDKEDLTSFLKKNGL